MKHANVSVVIPCYNSAKTVWRAVDSVFNQTLIPKEVVLIDDCSSDDTLNVLYDIRDYYPIGWVVVVASKENGGAASARNLGWDISSSEYIAFLDSDDSWHKRKVEYQYNWMKENRRVVLTGHDCVCLNDIEEKGDEDGFGELIFKKISKERALVSNCFSTPTVMLKRDIPFRFLNGKRYSEDYLLWLEVIMSGYHCYKLALPLTVLYKSRYGESGLSSQLWNMEVGELETINEIHRKGFICFICRFFLISYSMAKFLVRLLKVKVLRKKP